MKDTNSFFSKSPDEPQDIKSLREKARKLCLKANNITESRWNNPNSDDLPQNNQALKEYKETIDKIYRLEIERYGQSSVKNDSPFIL